MATYGTANLNFGRGARAHRRDIRRALTVHGVDVLAAQELRRRMADVLAPVVRTFQPDRAPDVPGSEALFVARGRGVLTVDKGSIVASHDRHGQAIGKRRIPWLLVDDPDLDSHNLVIDYHRVPLRMQDSPIAEAQDRRCRELVAWGLRDGFHVTVLGDMQQLIRADPAGLVEHFGGRWAGTRIDLGWLSDGLRVAATHHVQDTRRRDRHPLVVFEIKEK